MKKKKEEIKKNNFFISTRTAFKQQPLFPTPYSLLPFFFFFLFSLFICSCSDPFTATTFEKPPEGYGSFSLRINAQRTILPGAPSKTDFKAYTLIFTSTDGGDDQTENHTNETLASSITLKVGTYDLTVKAYLDIEKTRFVAQGTLEDIEISSTPVSSEVTLKALSNDGFGTFSWNINISASNVTSAVMVIKQDGAGIIGSPVNLLDTDKNPGALTSLIAGVYNITITLIKGVAKEEAVWNELLYIYGELTSNFPSALVFDDTFFYRTHYNVTFDSNGGSYVGPQSVMHGGTVPMPSSPPTYPGYEFGGWYTDPNPGSGDSSYVFSTPVFDDFTLYAKWIDNSPSNPYKVTNATELRYVGRGDANPTGYKNWTLTAYYLQTANINLTGTGDWIPIGTSDENSFTGNYNGGGKTITGLTIDVSGYAGMFNYIGFGGMVENLGLIDVDIKGGNPGGIVGQNAGSTNIGGTIQNCYVTGKVTGINGAGGIANLNRGIIQNCYFNGNFESGGVNGGIASWNLPYSSTGGIIKNCYVTGSFTASFSSTSDLQSGGIAGYNTGTIQNCVALNEKITVSYSGSTPTIGRVSGGPSTTNLSNNYAWDGMKLTRNGSNVSTYPDINDKDGMSIPAAIARTQTTWTTVSWGGANFDFSDNGPWVWNGTAGMPSLRVFGNENVPPWAWYLVDQTYNVASLDEWETVVGQINSDYSVTYFGINITNSFSINGTSQNYTFLKGNVTINGNNNIFTLTGTNSMLKIRAGQTVTIRDLTILGDGTRTNALIDISATPITSVGTFIMEGNAKVTGNISSNNTGGGVFVNSGGIFIMNGGEVSDNEANGSGGGVYISSNGTFTMNGGKVSRNKNSTGAGVYIGGSNGTFIMNGGEVSDNEASNSGGGVYINNNGTFIMNGGKVSRNTAGNYGYGGGVIVSAGAFIMNSGEVSGNKILGEYNSYGGGVNVSSDGTFRIVTGTVYGSTETDTALRNTAVSGAALYKNTSGIAERGIFFVPGDITSTWIPANDANNGILTSTNATIRVINGVLQ